MMWKSSLPWVPLGLQLAIIRDQCGICRALRLENGESFLWFFSGKKIYKYIYIYYLLESRRRRTKGSVVGEEWCQNAAPLRWYTKNVFAQSKMILSRAWLHDTVSCAAWNDARKGVYLKPLFKTPCSNCYWGWSKPIMLDYMERVPLLWRTVTASPVGIEPMTILSNT